MRCLGITCRPSVCPSSMGVSRDCPNFLGTPYDLRNGYSYGLQIFSGTFIGSIGTEAHDNVGNSGRSQGVPKMFRAPIYKDHCSFIFAIARLSCNTFKTSHDLIINTHK